MEDKAVIIKCPCCGASMKKHWHRLSQGLVGTLLKFREACIKNGTYRIHVPNQISLTKTEYNNFQKLRYHALIAKSKGPDGSRDSGIWILTKRGNQFCKNKIKVPVRVQTFRNKISERSNELADIYEIMEIIGDKMPYWDTIHDFEYELADAEVVDHEDIKKDDKGNILLF